MRGLGDVVTLSESLNLFMRIRPSLAQTCPTINYSDSEDWQLWSSLQSAVSIKYKNYNIFEQEIKNPVKMDLAGI